MHGCLRDCSVFRMKGRGEGSGVDVVMRWRRTREGDENAEGWRRTSGGDENTEGVCYKMRGNAHRIGGGFRGKDSTRRNWQTQIPTGAAEQK